MVKIICSLFLITFYTGAIAQQYIDLAKFHYVTTPENNFDSIGGSTTIQEFGTDLTLPIKISDKNAIITGCFLEKIKTKLSPLSSPTSVSAISLKVGLNRKHNQKWSGTYLLLPKIASDLEKIGSRDFQLGALVLMKYHKKEHLKYNIGVYYNKELFGSFVVPILGLYYKSPNDKLEINMSLPVWADINYKLNPWLSIGSNFTSFVRSYNLSESNTYLVKKSNETYAYLQLTVKESFLIQTKVGYSIGRSYRAYENDDQVDFGFSAFRFGDDRTVLNPDAEDGLVFKVRLLYRFHLK